MIATLGTGRSGAPLARAARRIGQVLLLLLAGALIVHGLTGPPLAARNLSTLGVWVYYRGLLLILLVAAGNFFCMACPMVLLRDVARRWHTPSRTWPRGLRTKWLSLGLLVAVLFGYERFDWWNDPVATAILLASVFALALLVDLVFKQASFCKFVCPVGQFSFVASTLSPVEVAVRDAGVCGSCRTKDCIEPGPSSHGAGRGCELGLFQPRKVGNLDCTFCLDCVAACPHGNVGLAARLPGEELWSTGFRSGVGRTEKRSDLAALVTVFTFGALLNAFGMVSPVYAVQELLAAHGVASETAFLLLLFTLGVVVEPVVLVGLTSALTARSLPRREPLLRVAARYVPTLAPMGVAIWLSHYSFHLLVGFWSFVPVLQREAARLGVPILGPPTYAPGVPEAAVYPLEILMLVAGLLASWVVAWNIASAESTPRAHHAFLPWAGLCSILFAAAVWVLSQPMEMRGTMPP